MKTRSPLKQAGISLLEVLLSLSIIAIILVMATRYFFVASNNDKVNITRQEIGSVIGAIKQWKNQNPTYDSTSALTSKGLSIPTLYKEGFLANSKNMKNINSDNPQLFNPWGYEITLSTPTANSITIMTTLPAAKECTSLLASYPEANPPSHQCTNGSFTLEIGKPSA